jgi:hypothetical protein
MFDFLKSTGGIIVTSLAVPAYMFVMVWAVATDHWGGWVVIGLVATPPVLILLWIFLSWLFHEMR